MKKHRKDKIRRGRTDALIQNSNEGRIYRFDYMKAFLIFCVVLGHITYWFPGESYLLHCTQLWIYFFHMPAFVFLSGLFSKNTVNRNKWEKAVPYCFIFLFMKAVNYFVDVYRGLEGAKIVFFSAEGVEWYALAMFWWFAVTIAIKKVHPCYVLIVSVVLSIISGYTNTDGSFLVWQRAVTMYPFFYLGYMLEVDQIVKWCEVHKKTKMISSALLLLILYLIIYFCHVNQPLWLKLLRGNFSYQEIFNLANPMFGGGYRLLAYVISVVLIFALITVFPDRKIKAFSYIGRNTLPVYALHSPMIPFLFALSSGHLKSFMLETNLFSASIVFSIFLVIFTSLPFFCVFLGRIMEVPMKK